MANGTSLTHKTNTLCEKPSVPTLIKTKINSMMFKANISSVAQSCLALCAPWTVSLQAPLSMGFSRQEYRSGLPLPTPGDLPKPGIKPKSLNWQADSLPLTPPGKPNN